MPFAEGAPTPTPSPGGTSAARYSFAGTRFRQPTKAGTVNSGNPYQVTQFAFATPDYQLADPRFFFQTFYNLTSGASTHEVATTSPITIEGMSFLLDGVWVRADPTLFPITIDPAVDTVGKLLPAFTNIALPVNSLVQARIAWFGTGGMTVPGPETTWGSGGEAARGGTSSMADFLTNGSSLNNSNATTMHPSMMVAKGGDGRPALLAIGDSIGFGQNSGVNGAMFSARGEFGYLGTGFDSNASSKRIPVYNMCVPGQSPGNWSTPANIAKKLALLQMVIDETGAAPCDEIVNQHGTNSISGTSTLTQLQDWTRATLANFRGVVGEDMPATQAEMIAYPASSNGYADLAGQSVNTQNAYPGGVRWQFNASVGGADGLGDPAATLRADGTIQHSFAPWREGSYDTGANRDKLRILEPQTTLAADWSNASSFSSVLPFQVGDYVVAAGSSTEEAMVTSGPSGTGPYSHGSALQSFPLTTLPAGTPIRATMHGGGLHPGKTGHDIYAASVVAYKQQRGWA
jgi:hypothetical protein